MAPQVGTPSGFPFPALRALLCGMERISDIGLMAWKVRLATATTRHPRVARAAGWALLGGVAAMSGWKLVHLIDSLDTWLGESLAIGPFYVSPLGLIVGSLHIVVPAADDKTQRRHIERA